MKCRLCNGHQVEVYFDFGQQPIANALTATKVDPPRYPFEVGYCHDCGFQQLMHVIPPAHLYRNYATPSSWKHQPHSERLIETAAALFGISRNDHIFEIGCNDGSFLALLGVLGYCNTAGIEPTANCATAAKARGFHVQQGFFGPAMKLYAESDKPRLIVSRHVLEHVPDIHSFLAGCKETLADGGGLVIEVPDHAAAYENLDYAYWEEHVNYFTVNTLRFALARAGFDVVHVETALFSGRSLTVYAQHARAPDMNPPRNRDAGWALDHRVYYPRFREAAKWYTLDGPVTPTGRVVLYGAGCRAINFCNLLGVAEWIDAVVDDRAEKQGLWVPGIGRQVQAPTAEILEGSHVLLGVNAENESALLRRSPATMCAESILPPSRRLPQWWREMIA